MCERIVRVNTTIYVERIKELEVRTTDEPGEELAIDCGDTDNKIFLGKNCIKVLDRNNIKVDRESRENASEKECDTDYFILGLRPRGHLSWGEEGVSWVLRAGTKSSHH